ncbi:13744_t:CDS:2, partial [Gigaspora margarita]
MGDNETRGSSSTAAASQNGGAYASEINIGSNLPNTTMFLVHLPQIDPSIQPAVIGSCATLGKWKDTKVQLKQVPKTTLWKSDTIQIPISEDVFYKYALIASQSNMKALTNQTHNYMAVYSLPESFQSANLLEDLASVDPDLFHSDIRHLILGAIRILVQHNSLQGSTSWFKMFSLAPKLDTSYSFIDSAESYDFKNNNDQFCVALLEYLKPKIYELLNRLDVFHKVIKKLINITYNLESLIFLWNDIVGLERMDNYLCKMMKRKIIEFIKFDDPSRLKDHFNLFSNELQDIVAPEFRNKLRKLLNERNLKWKKKNIDCFQELLQNDLLQWSLEEYAR